MARRRLLNEVRAPQQQADTVPNGQLVLGEYDPSLDYQTVPTGNPAVEAAKRWATDQAIQLAKDAAGRAVNRTKTAWEEYQNKTGTGNGNGQQGPRTPKPTPGPSRPPGKGNGNGNGNGRKRKRPRGSGSQQTTYSQANTSAYGNIRSGSEVRLSSPLDTTYWYNILQNQTSDATKNDVRTTVNLIRVEPDSLFINSESTSSTSLGYNPLIETAMKSIYAHQLTEIIGGTGGNSSVKFSFTYNNIWKYYQYALSACYKLAEVYALRAWDPPFEETNTVIRQMKNAVNSSTLLLETCQNLEEALANYAIPSEFINLAKFTFQTYKRSPVSGGVHWKFMTFEMFKDLSEEQESDNFPNTVVSMNSLIQKMLDTDIPSGATSSWAHHMGTITSYLLQKCRGFESCRSSKVGSSYPVYNEYANAIVNNMRYGYQQNGVNKVSLTTTSKDDILKVAFPMDQNNVPKFVSATLLLNYNVFATSVKADASGYPFFHQMKVDGRTRYLFKNDSTADYNISSVPIDYDIYDITDNNYRLYSNGATYFKPVGLNTQLFAPTFDVVNNSCRDYLYQLFNMPSID